VNHCHHLRVFIRMCESYLLCKIWFFWGVTGLGLRVAMVGVGAWTGSKGKFEELEFCLIISALWGATGGKLSLVGIRGWGFWLRDGATNCRVTGVRVVGERWVWFDRTGLDKSTAGGLERGRDAVSGISRWGKGEGRIDRDWTTVGKVVGCGRDDLCNPIFAVLSSAMYVQGATCVSLFVWVRLFFLWYRGVKSWTMVPNAPSVS